MLQGARVMRGALGNQLNVPSPMCERRPPVDATDKVLDAMKNAGEPLNAGKIVDLTGLDRKEVDKAMNDLKKTERIVSPKRCYWEPKA